MVSVELWEWPGNSLNELLCWVVKVTRLCGRQKGFSHLGGLELHSVWSASQYQTALPGQPPSVAFQVLLVCQVKHPLAALSGLCLRAEGLADA